jgi:hypothetical protein
VIFGRRPDNTGGVPKTGLIAHPNEQRKSSYDANLKGVDDKWFAFVTEPFTNSQCGARVDWRHYSQDIETSKLGNTTEYDILYAANDYSF